MPQTPNQHWLVLKNVELNEELSSTSFHIHQKKRPRDTLNMNELRHRRIFFDPVSPGLRILKRNFPKPAQTLLSVVTRQTAIFQNGVYSGGFSDTTGAEGATVK
jgi:hypothetical protein